MSAARPEPTPERAALVTALRSAARPLDVHCSDEPIEGETPIHDLRRRRRRPLEDKVGRMTLREVDGVLFWSEGTAAKAPAGRRGRRRRGTTATGEVIEELRFKKLEPNRIGAFLEDFDRARNGHRGLRRLRGGRLAAVATPPADGRTLLFLHGTASNNDHIVAQLRSTAQGAELLARAEAHYDQVLAFDHATLSVSPLLNALDLDRLFAPVRADVDVIAHSRGGLVARWWLDALASAGPGRRRAVLIGSPLGGTSLAAPPRLRASMSLLTNVGRALQLAGTSAAGVAPFLALPIAVLKVVTSVTGLAARTPLLDAAVALVPGLAAQSRVENNGELARLRKTTPAVPVEYSAVRTNFESEDPGWRFWRRFRGTQLADRAAELVFDGANDLVVDSDSMTELPSGLPAARLLDYGTSTEVHHVNYLTQPRTIAFLRKRLGL